MSSEPLRIGMGTKFAAAFATFLTVFTTPFAGFVLSSYVVLYFAPTVHPPDSPSLHEVFGVLGLGLAAVLLGQAFINLALGRRRTRGGAARFLRYQLGGIGIGAGAGLCLISLLIGSYTISGVAGLLAGVLVFGVSLLAFKSSRARHSARTPRPDIVVTEAEVVEHWSGHFLRLPNPQMAVIGFTDAEGTRRLVRHIVRQRSIGTGTTGQVEYDRRRPERFPRFTPSRPTHTPPRDRLGDHS